MRDVYHREEQTSSNDRGRNRFMVALDEVRRVLSPRGRAFLTFYVVDDDAAARIADGRAAMAFETRLEDCLTIDAATPERAVAYRHGDLDRLLCTAGLEWVQPLFRGRWTGRQDGLDYQDIAVLKANGQN